ncbi:FG-GAP repeat domain-containing protein [Haloferula sp.]|uniref:FG-GAP repeat domain-containing protein n=1 Tax=Haloferula sp. TaxID=2497595 RepID=UPI003C7322BC
MKPILLLIAAPAFAQAASLDFEIRQLALDANEGVAIADVDQDGQLDIVAGRNWYAGPDFITRPLRSIADWNGYIESNGDFIHDVNQDGFPDVVAGSFIQTEVSWYENPGKKGLSRGQHWKAHILHDTGFSQNEGSFLRDLDDNGTPEWITNSWNPENPLMVWHLVRKNQPTRKTDRTPTLQGCTPGGDGQSHGLGFGDLNNDGREDLITGHGWYERPEKNIWEKPWTFHADWPHLHSSVPMLVRDLNGDGLNDLIWGKGHDYGLFWWESTGIKDGKFTWKEHLIDKSYSQPHTLHLADLTGDGQEELITGKRVRAHNGKDPGGNEPPCLYYYVWSSKEGAYTRHTIDEGRVGCGLQIATADLNGDGTTDIAVAGKSGTYLIFNLGPEERQD